MTQLSKNYAKVLYELGISGECIETAKNLCAVKELMDALNSPIVTKKTKHRIVEKTFPKEMQNFMKKLCDNGSTGYLEEIFIAYESFVHSEKNTLEAKLVCVEPPSVEQRKKIEQFLIGEYHKSEVRLDVCMDNSLIGGFILKVNDDEYDWSLRGRIAQLTGHLKNK